MATTSIADKLAKLEKKIAKREKTIADETKELDKDKAEYNKLYIMFLSDKYKLSGKDLFSAIEREHDQLEKLREGEQSDDDTDNTSLIEKMRECGYVFTNEKRMIAKPANVKYGCSVTKLGYGYSMEMLQARIANKQNEFAGIKISAFFGVQVDYAVTVREKQIELYRSRSVSTNISYAEVRRTMELLNYVHDNHIHSVDDMKVIVSDAEMKVEKLSKKYFFLEKQEKLLALLNEYGSEYDRLLNHTDRNAAQQKRLEELYRKLIHAGLCGYDTHSPDWLSKLKNTIQQRLTERKDVLAQLNRASNEFRRVKGYLYDLEKTLNTDFDRIRKQENLREQIEMYHQGYELQEDGTYVKDPEVAAERNAELDYLARLEAEKQHRAEMEYLMKLEQQEKQERARRRSYGHSR